MRRFLRFLRPMIFLRRKAILAGVLGGNRKWLVWGGMAWVLHWLGQLFGAGDPKPKYTREIGAGERVIVLHEPLSPAQVKKAEKKAARAQRKAAKAERRAAAAKR